ncbi:hypothetical protein [Streptomyces thermolilacinus]|uniref:Lipoprotein n=1 Tax=Streptomyces thermolilacinus SPC6 TaxID=1306406 RepID=A0A1D3DUR1_9ACTN|nr:hypothetical protein [Streptomyces thermolilacinus]OEJ96060.1 hypothetical protein J116_017880 [Streptomyces thermolilacinus SPC6]
MNTRLGAWTLPVFILLITLTGCDMNEEPNKVPFVGTSTSIAAANDLEKVSSDIYDLIAVKGEASDTQAGVMNCAGRDREKYFRVFHPWSFYPASPDQLDEAMQQLKQELPKNGWTIVRYGPDRSLSKNLTLTADNDERKSSVEITQDAKNDRPKLSLMLVSGCYEIPAGQEIERF